MLPTGSSSEANFAGKKSSAPHISNFKPVAKSRTRSKDQQTSSAIPSLQDAINKPLSPEQTEELLNEVGSNWLFGQGIGETALTIGAVVMFPPYAFAVVGNAALQLGGEEPIGLSTVLPEEESKAWGELYDSVTSVPGRGVAIASGEEYRDKQIARERIKNVLDN